MHCETYLITCLILTRRCELISKHLILHVCFQTYIRVHQHPVTTMHHVRIHRSIITLTSVTVCHYTGDNCKTDKYTKIYLSYQPHRFLPSLNFHFVLCILQSKRKLTMWFSVRTMCDFGRNPLRWRNARRKF